MTPESTHETVLDAAAARGRIARVYAEALFETAEAAGVADVTGEELDALVAGVLGAGGAAGYLANPTVGKRLKGEVLGNALAGRTSDLVRGLLGVMNNHGRLGLVRGVAAAYRAIIDGKAGRVRVSVTSAVPLTDDQKERLTKTLAEKLGLKPALAAAVDPSLLGGMVVRVGDSVIDTSVRTRLESLRSQLLDQGNSYVRNQV